jgi:hypothetical protein
MAVERPCEAMELVLACVQVCGPLQELLLLWERTAQDADHTAFQSNTG